MTHEQHHLHSLRVAVDDMQNRRFYVEDGVLRRWYPPDLQSVRTWLQQEVGYKL